MTEQFRRAVVLSLVLAACRGDATDTDPLAQDTTIARELGMAMADSLEEPVMTTLVSASNAGGAEPQASGAPEPAQAGTSAEPASAARSTGDRGSPAAPAPASSPTAGTRTTAAGTTAAGTTGARTTTGTSGTGTTGSRTAGTAGTSDSRASSSAGTPQRSTASPQGSVPQNQSSPASSRTASTPSTAAQPIATSRTSTSSTSSRTIAPGTNLALRSDATICTNTHKVGQGFAAQLTNAVTAADGSTIPSGSRAVLEITQLKRSDGSGDPIAMGFRVTSVASGGRVFAVNAPASSASIARVRNQSRSSDAKKVATGAAVGAAVGGVLGRDAKSTVGGAAAGAIVGAAAAAASARYEGCLPVGGRINATVAG